MAVYFAATPLVVGTLPQVLKFSTMPDWDLEFNKSAAGRRPSAPGLDWLGWRLPGPVPGGFVRVTVGSRCSCGLADAGVAPMGFVGNPNSTDPIPKVETEIAASVLTDSDKESLYDAYRFCDESTLASWRAVATPTDLPQIAFDLNVHDTIVNLKKQVDARDDAEQSHLASAANVPFIQARCALRTAKPSGRAVARARLAALSTSASLAPLKAALAPFDKAVVDAHTELVVLLDSGPDEKLKGELLTTLRPFGFAFKRRLDIGDEVHTDVILKLLASIGSYDEARHGGWRWVKTIIKSEVMSFLRRLGRQTAHVLPPGNFGPQPTPALPHRLTSCWQVNKAIVRLASCPSNPVWAGHTIAFLEEFDAAGSDAAGESRKRPILVRKRHILAFSLISVLDRPAEIAAWEMKVTLRLPEKPPKPTISRWNSAAITIIQLRYLERELLSECVLGGTPRLKAISIHLTQLFGGAPAEDAVARGLGVPLTKVRAELGGCLTFAAADAVTALSSDLASAIGGKHLTVEDAIKLVEAISRALRNSSVPLWSVAGTAWPPPKAWLRSGLAIVLVCRRCNLLSACRRDLKKLSATDQVQPTAELVSIVASMQWSKAEAFFKQYESSFPALCKTLRRFEELFQSYDLFRTGYPSLLGSESGILLAVLASASQTVPRPAGAPATAALSSVLGLSELPWKEVTDTLLGVLPTNDVLRNQVADGALSVRVVKLLATSVGPPGLATSSAWATWLANGDSSSVTPSVDLSSIEFEHWFALGKDRRRELLGQFEVINSN